MRWILGVGLALGAGLIACRKKDQPKPNQPPMVRFFVDSIGLEGPDRLPSRFTLRWYGEDPDGYVVGYELRIENMPWSFTPAQESTFVVSFSPGELYKDLVFELRAVDNLGARTEPPARLRVPLRNSPPHLLHRSPSCTPGYDFARHHPPPTGRRPRWRRDPGQPICAHRQRPLGATPRPEHATYLRTPRPHHSLSYARL